MRNLRLTNLRFPADEISHIKAVIHTIVMPILVAVIVYQFQQSWSAVSALAYVGFISFLHHANCKVEPTTNNYFKKQLFFEALGSWVYILGSIALIIIF